MSDLEFSIGKTDDLIRNLERAGDKAVELLTRALMVEAELIMTEAKQLAPVDEGILRASGFVRDASNNARGPEDVVIELGFGGAASGYAVYIHEGTGPAVGRPAFFPPVEPFAEWAGRVLGDESLGFVIARAVGRRGLEPRKFLEKPLKKRATGMAGRVAKRVRSEFNRGRA